jgi:hypothetical protein
MIKYLPFFDYVVQVSLDTYVANRSYSFEHWLEGLPDVVLSVRSNQDTFEYTKFFPERQYPTRPRRVTGKDIPLLQTETMLVKNSAFGVQFCNNLLKYDSLINQQGLDKTACQRAALEFVSPETAELRNLKQFGNGWTSQKESCSFLIGAGVWGRRGPFCMGPPGNNDLSLMVHYKVTTEFLSRKRDYKNENGHLRMLKEGEMVRDWNRGKLLFGGDFILHGKKVWCNGEYMKNATCNGIPLLDDADMSCRGGLVAHPELFEPSVSKSIEMARSYAYDVSAVFAKTGITV